MARNEEGLKDALEKIPALREEFWNDVNVPGDGEELNQSLEKAGRVADFLEFGELMCLDALDRENPAAAISARSTRPPTARPCATTSTSPRRRLGIHGRQASPSGTSSRWRSRTSSSKRGATSDERPGNRRSDRKDGTCRERRAC